MLMMEGLLARHTLMGLERSGTYACTAPGCSWEYRRGTVNYFVGDVDVVSRKFAAHLSEVLRVAGFGDMAQAWEEGATAGLGWDENRGEDFKAANPYSNYR